MSSSGTLLPAEALQQNAFNVLADVFTRYEPPEPGQEAPYPTVELEILESNAVIPDGHLILQDPAERAIGVPKKVLVAAYLHARQLLVSTPASERESKEIDDATRIILLYDPEHLTAANARKQNLLNILSMKAVYGPMHQMMLSFAVQKELWFLTSILTSPLHRQTKSPTLWYQRAWIYFTFVDHCDFLFATKGYLMGELEIVLKSAERHQHNYYAFNYARRVLQPALAVVEKRETNKVDANPKLNHKAVLDRLLTWCKAHPSDTSGWSFLSYWMEHTTDVSANLKVVQSVLRFANDLLWKGEALWTFLRGPSRVGDATELVNEKEKLVHHILDAMAELCPRFLPSDVKLQQDVIEPARF